MRIGKMQHLFTRDENILAVISGIKQRNQVASIW